MSMRGVMAGEGASMPWVRSERASGSGLVVCPMLPLGHGMEASWVEEIYRLAFERARAALRPSAYERILQECPN
jgi:hypothetical protein